MKVICLLFLTAFVFSKQLKAQDTLATGLESTLCDSIAYKYVAPGSPPISILRARNPLPSFDLSTFLPFVEDQGVQWSCTAFSVCAALSILDNQQHGKRFNTPDFSARNYIFSPAFIFNVAKSKYPN